MCTSEWHVEFLHFWICADFSLSGCEQTETSLTVYLVQAINECHLVSSSHHGLRAQQGRCTQLEMPYLTILSLHSSMSLRTHRRNSRMDLWVLFQLISTKQNKTQQNLSHTFFTQLNLDDFSFWLANPQLCTVLFLSNWKDWRYPFVHACMHTCIHPLPLWYCGSRLSSVIQTSFLWAMLSSSSSTSKGRCLRGILIK